MLKALGLFLLSMMSAPLAANSVSENFKPAPMNEIRSVGIYDDVTFTHVSDTLWVCDSTDLSPAVEKHFSAPYGFAFVLRIDEEKVDKMIEVAIDAGASFESSYLLYSYTTQKMTVSSEAIRRDFYSFETQDVQERGEIIKQFILDNIDERLLFERTESFVDDEIAVSFDFYFYRGNDIHGNPQEGLTLRFPGEVFPIKAFSETDFVRFESYSYDQEDSNTSYMRLSAYPTEGFFSGEEPYNIYGFDTDEEERTVGVKEPEVQEVSIEEFYTLPDSHARAYTLKGKIQSIFEPTDPNVTENIYGQLELIDVDKALDDDTAKKLYINGLTATKSALAWDGFSQYTFTNPVDYISIPYTSNLKVGDCIEVKILPDGEETDGMEPPTVLKKYATAVLLSIKHTNGKVTEVKTTANYTLRLVSDNFVLGTFDGHFLRLDYPDNPITCRAKLEFKSGGKEYTYYSRYFVIGKPNASMKIDNVIGRKYIEREVESEFTLDVNYLNESNPVFVMTTVTAYPYRLWDDEEHGLDYFDGEFPIVGEEGRYYYEPSAYEKSLISQGKYEEYLDMKAEGTYKVWDSKSSSYKTLSVPILDVFYYNTGGTIDESFDFEKLNTALASLPYVGRWYFKIDSSTSSPDNQPAFFGTSFNNTKQTIEVVVPTGDKNEIVLDMPDNINLILGGDSIDVNASINGPDHGSNDFYYDYELSKDNVIKVTKGENGKLNILPLAIGNVDLTITCDSPYFAKLEKQVRVRILDSAVYDVARIKEPDEFHEAGKDLTLAISLRGFTNIQNLPIEWTVVDKDGNAIDANKFRTNRDATMTLLSPDTGDYTVTAFYEGVELDKITVQVRYVNVNKFLISNLWWIIVITILFTAFIIFLSIVTKRGKTTVEHIERVYDVYCHYISDDKLTEYELKRIKREITKCLHRVQDLNIDALDQYEKATRYLRKSLDDTKRLLKNYEAFTKEERDILTNLLDKDLSKALMVSKEIEVAKGLIEAHHAEANRQNYEMLETEKKGKKNKKGKGMTDDPSATIERMANEISDEPPITMEDKEKKHE